MWFFYYCSLKNSWNCITPLTEKDRNLFWASLSYTAETLLIFTKFFCSNRLTSISLKPILFSKEILLWNAILYSWWGFSLLSKLDAIWVSKLSIILVNMFFIARNLTCLYNLAHVLHHLPLQFFHYSARQPDQEPFSKTFYKTFE